MSNFVKLFVKPFVKLCQTAKKNVGNLYRTLSKIVKNCQTLSNFVKLFVKPKILKMNLYIHRYKNELSGLPKTKISRLYKAYAKYSNREFTLKRIAEMQQKYEIEKQKARERKMKTRPRRDETTPPIAIQNETTAENNTEDMKDWATGVVRERSEKPQQDTDDTEDTDRTTPRVPAVEQQRQIQTRHRQEQERLERDRQEQERLERDRQEQERLARHRQEQERLERHQRQQEEQERLAKHEEERLEKLSRRRLEDELQLKLKKQKEEFEQERLYLQNLLNEAKDLIKQRIIQADDTRRADIEEYKAHLNAVESQRDKEEVLSKINNPQDRLVVEVFDGNTLRKVIDARTKVRNDIITEYEKNNMHGSIPVVLRREENRYYHQIRYLYTKLRLGGGHGKRLQTPLEFIKFILNFKP